MKFSKFEFDENRLYLYELTKTGKLEKTFGNIRVYRMNETYNALKNYSFSSNSTSNLVLENFLAFDKYNNTYSVYHSGTTNSVWFFKSLNKLYCAYDEKDEILLIEEEITRFNVLCDFVAVNNKLFLKEDLIIELDSIYNIYIIRFEYGGKFLLIKYSEKGACEYKHALYCRATKEYEKDILYPEKTLTMDDFTGIGKVTLSKFVKLCNKKYAQELAEEV